MRIGIRANDFDGRGCGKTARDYAFSLVNRGHEVFFLASSKTPNIRANALSPHGKIIYNDFVTEVDKPEIITKALEGLIDTHQIDFLQMVKYGYDDGVLPKNCRTGVHCVFEMNQPHGTVYTAVSENLARQYGCAHYVPHIVRRIEPSENWRRKLGIPADAVVFGRHGGADQFNLRFVHSVISDILQSNRKDIYFLFLCTDKFCNDHKRLIRIPWVESDQDVANFIHACDCMIHARHMGETFGLAVGEFSACNKPVMTWSGVGAIGASSYDTAHLDHLGERALIYSDKASLQKLILDFDRNEMRKKSWDCFSVPFGEERVMAQYQEVFLESKEPSRAIQPEIVPEIHAETQKASARLDYNEVFERHGTDKGPLCHNYGRIYEHLFGQFSDRPFTLLEIGVYRGNSIKAWREIFPLAKIVGVDLSDAHVNEFESNVTIEVGDQGDPVFLESLKKKYRQFEVVIDDGSHKPRDQQIALNSLWSILTTGGVYVIEDLQVAYNDPWQSEGYVPTLDYLKSIVTRAGIKEGLETPWIVFAGELAAIIKPDYAGRPKAARA